MGLNLIGTMDDHCKSMGDRFVQIYREERFTYGELGIKSDALAFFLIETYKNDKTPIVVIGHKQAEMLVSFLACSKSGHPYIPIDSTLPIDRVYNIIESSKAKLVLNIGNLDLKNTLCNVMDLKEVIHKINKYDGFYPDPQFRVNQGDVVYIIYTSGSTGDPKGVQITQKCIETFIAWLLDVCKLNNDQQYIFMNQAPYSFDLSVMNLYPALYTGSTMYNIDKEMNANFKELFSHLQKSNINIWVSTPSFAEMCIADNSFNEDLMPELKQMLFCGEVLTNKCAKELLKRFKDVKVINTYGPTETTVAVTAVEIDENIYSTYDPLPIGIIGQDAKVMVCDENGNSVPDGTKGEMHIFGNSVGPGYYNNPVITEKSFYSQMKDGIVTSFYRTGDQGYIKDGFLYYSGRIDFQVKLNGYRIELEDIENNLRKIAVVKNAIVLPVMKDGKVQYLAAFVLLNQEINEKEFKIALMLKNELKNFLPEYMIPRKISIKESFPVNTNGKINRKLLLEELR